MSAEPFVEINGRRLELVEGDITTERVDAIANAASTELRGGSGVDGAIHRAAGPGLLDELVERYPNGAPTGTAVPTGGHELPVMWVLHAVGPVWQGGGEGEAEQLAEAYRSCLRLADEQGVRSLAFPGISMGIYGYPHDEAARIAVGTVADHLRGTTSLTLVRFVLRRDTYPAFAAALLELRSADSGEE